MPTGPPDVTGAGRSPAATRAGDACKLVKRRDRGREEGRGKERTSRDVIPMAPAETIRYNERTAVERTNGRLKEEFGSNNVKVSGHSKVKMHLMFGMIALFADQLLKLML